MADAVIQQCDQAITHAQATAVAAAAHAQATAVAAATATTRAAIVQVTKAAQDQHAQQVTAKKKDTCDRVGGQFGTGVFGTGCRVFYRASGDRQRYPYDVGFDDEGNVVPWRGDPATAQADCQSGRALPSGAPGTWHPDTAICSL